MKLHGSEQKYAQVLRAIGQDLTDLYPESLEIELSGDEYIARGRGRANLPKSQHDDEKPSGLKKIWNKLSQPSPKPHTIPVAPSRTDFVRTYTPNDIRRLDESGAARRRTISERPDLYSLEERLRMIGRIADEKRVELRKLSQDSNTVTFEYRDEDDQAHSESWSTLELYKLQHEYYLGRRESLIDPWEGIRR